MFFKSLKNYPLSALTFTAVCVLSLMPFPEIKAVENVPLADKWTHFIMYGSLTAVTLWEMHRNKKATKSMMTLIVAYVLLGGALELLQAYATTTRSGEWLDWLADTIGVAIGTLIGYLSRYL